MGCGGELAVFEENTESNELQKELDIKISQDTKGNISSITLDGETYNNIQSNSITRCIGSAQRIQFGNNTISGEDLSITTPEGKFSLIGKVPDSILSKISKTEFSSANIISGSSDQQDAYQESVFLAIDTVGFDLFDNEKYAPYFNFIGENWDNITAENKSEFKDLIRIYAEMNGETGLKDNFPIVPQKDYDTGKWEFILPNTAVGKYGDLLITNGP